MKKLLVFWIVLVLAAVSYLPFNSPKVSGQNLPEREFVKRSFQNEPVKIVSLSAPNAKITPGQKFIAPDNWLDQVEFKIQNVSGKTIIGVTFMFLIRDIPGLPSSLGVPFTYGKVPDIESPHITDPPVKPNSVMGMKITHEMFEEIKTGVEHTAKLADVRRVDMVLIGVYFSDGSCWEGGSFFDKSPLLETQTSKELPPATLASIGFCGVEDGYDRAFCCSSNSCTHYVRRVRIRPSVNKQTGAESFEVYCKCDSAMNTCSGASPVPCDVLYPPIS
ncbi:MAG TPA: hypothetical protein PLL06_06205 [Acidobacteriota bacterium]|nr:hypothetical protein [Acidobacteriota bacterium]